MHDEILRPDHEAIRQAMQHIDRGRSLLPYLHSCAGCTVVRLDPLEDRVPSPCDGWHMEPLVARAGRE